jgi:anti-anti-sigma factor
VETSDSADSKPDRPEGPDVSGASVEDRLEVRGSIAKMTVAFRDHQVVVSVAGELDLVDRDIFASLMEQVRARHPQRIVIDLANLEFLSVPMLHELERDGTGAELVVANAYGIVKRVLELAGSVNSEN